MANPTVQNTSDVNATLMNKGTIQNNAVSGGGLNQPFIIQKGAILLDKYMAESRIGEVDANGEADLFLCSYNEKKYVVKVYRREMEGDREIIEKLKQINSGSIAKIRETGRTAGRYAEVYDYYFRGSLADSLKRNHTFTSEELRTFVIPQLNEALHILHTHDIFHRDIKPSNIVFSNESPKKLVLIDFGFSYITQNQKSVRVSRQAFTPGYAAPEANYTNNYFDLSDYYSLGITLYELFVGSKPFDDKDSFSYMITKPGNMPDDLYQLIRGLTYIDVQNRHDPLNPNCRWGYEKVKKWLAGEKLNIPGEYNNTNLQQVNNRSIPPIPLCGQTYNDMDSLILAMCENWEAGRGLIFRDTLTKRFRNSANPTQNQLFWADIIDDIRINFKGSDDAKMAKILYMLSDKTGYFHCPIGSMKTLQEFGISLLNRLKSSSEIMVKAATTSAEVLVGSDVLLEVAKSEKAGSRVINVINEMKEMMQQNIWSSHGEEICCYLAYVISGSTKLDLNLPNGKVFQNVSELRKYLSSKSGSNYSDLYETCGYFINESHTMKPLVYGWLKAQGYDVSEFNI